LERVAWFSALFSRIREGPSFLFGIKRVPRGFGFMRFDAIFTKDEKPTTVIQSNGLPLGEEAEEDVI
jgi:hypothetical protein